MWNSGDTPWNNIISNLVVYNYTTNNKINRTFFFLNLKYNIRNSSKFSWAYVKSTSIDVF